MQEILKYKKKDMKKDLRYITMQNIKIQNSKRIRNRKSNYSQYLHFRQNWKTTATTKAILRRQRAALKIE